VHFGRSKNVRVGFYAFKYLCAFYPVTPLQIAQSYWALIVSSEDFFKSFANLVDGFHSCGLQHFELMPGQTANNPNSVVESFHLQGFPVTFHTIKPRMQV
jgi:hypothetical protein